MWWDTLRILLTTMALPNLADLALKRNLVLRVDLLVWVGGAYPFSIRDLCFGRVVMCAWRGTLALCKLSQMGCRFADSLQKPVAALRIRFTQGE